MTPFLPLLGALLGGSNLLNSAVQLLGGLFGGGNKVGNGGGDLLGNLLKDSPLAQILKQFQGPAPDQRGIDSMLGNMNPFGGNSGSNQGIAQGGCYRPPSNNFPSFPGNFPRCGNDVMYPGGSPTFDETGGNDGDITDDFMQPFPRKHEAQITRGADGSLTIDAGDGDDDINVSRDPFGRGVIVNVNGEKYYLTNEEAKNLKIKGGAGNDRITVDANVRTDLELHGGAGDDTIIGGSGNDKIFGGAGNDRLAGRGGDDEIYGGAGDDLMLGGRGNDRMFGGTGNDRMYGGRGNDQIHGGRGNDYARGGHGRDQVDGARTNFRETLADDFLRRQLPYKLLGRV